jgi:hypothetical protein
LLSSYSSDKGCIIELSKLQQIGAKFNFTDEAKEWLGDHPEHLGMAEHCQRSLKTSQ